MASKVRQTKPKVEKVEKVVKAEETVTWADIDRIAGLADKPIPDARLEELHHRIHGSVGLPFIRFLYRLAEFLKPALAVELGTEWRVTSAHLCGAAAAYGGHVVGVDDTILHPTTEQDISVWYPDVFTFIPKHSLKALPAVEALVEEHGKIGLLFQDTRPVGQWKEWEAYSPLMKSGSVWVGNFSDEPEVSEVWPRVMVEKKTYAGLRGKSLIWVAIL